MNRSGTAKKAYPRDLLPTESFHRVKVGGGGRLVTIDSKVRVTGEHSDTEEKGSEQL